MTKKIIIIIIFLTSFLGNVVSADTLSNGMTIPSVHPILFWNPERLSKAQAWASAHSYLPITQMDRAPFDYYDILFACVVLGNSTACTNAISNATTFSDSTTTSPGDDIIRANGEWVLLTYDWLYSSLTQLQRQTIIDNFNTWMTNQNDVVWGNQAMPTSNYFSGRMRNDFTLGVATFNENTIPASSFLNYWNGTLWNSFTNFVSPTGTLMCTEDGTSRACGGGGYGMYAQESQGQYSRYSLQYYPMMLASAKLLGRNLWNETTAFLSGALQTIYATKPAKTTSRGLGDVYKRQVPASA